jgi:protein-S-isoprenylcysteine O-methyltransferase Ste14
MGDLPLALLTATVWTYWLYVGARIVHVRRKTRHGVGLVPEQRKERYMWLVWVPLVAAWMILPLLALSRTGGPLAVPDFAASVAVYAALRWVAALVGVVCLAVLIRCMKQMGRNWRMDVSTEQSTQLITDGLFGRIRHPIYAFSMLLMACSAVVLPTAAMIAIAVVHVVLMNVKARNEERHLLQSCGDAYARYLAQTGRFFPRTGSPGA